MTRTVLISGASSGIGAATATVLAAAGHRVVLGARRVERCEAAAEEITAAGGTALALPLDVTDSASVADFVAQAEAAYGDIDAVVANAGRTSVGPTWETTPEEFTEVLEVNLLGAQRLAAATIPGMIERRRGDIVFLSSEVSQNPRPFSGGYAAAKWGLEGLIRCMQQELEGTGVRASLVRPGQTITEMGFELDMTKVTSALDSWIKFGHARHNNFLGPKAIARAIDFILATPAGVHIPQLDVFPEGALEES